MRIAAILQARMGSSRLPGKVLREIAGKPLLGHLVDRLAPCSGVTDWIIATTTQPEDDALEAWCRDRGVKCFRGSDWDVLDRFYQAAVQLPERPSHIIRICCDNPLHHHSVLDFVLREYFSLGVDYCSNSNFEPDYLEDGFDVEVFRFEALERAWTEARMLSEREHVTPYIKHSGHFSCAWRKYDERYRFKLSVDTEADLRLAEAIFHHMPDPLSFGLREVVDLLLQKPELLEINKESRINSGYEKSLREDRQVFE